MAAETCRSCMNGGGTNCADVEIARIITSGIVAIAVLCVVAIIAVKLIAAISACRAAKRERKWEIEDIERKMKAKDNG